MSEFAHAGLEIWLVWRPEAPTVAAAALRRRGGYLWPLAVTPVTNSSGSVGFGPITVRMARVPPQTVPLEPLHDQKVANYEPLVPIYEVVKTALVACPY